MQTSKPEKVGGLLNSQSGTSPPPHSIPPFPSSRRTTSARLRERHPKPKSHRRRTRLPSACHRCPNRRDPQGSMSQEVHTSELERSIGKCEVLGNWFPSVGLVCRSVCVQCTRDSHASCQLTWSLKTHELAGSCGRERCILAKTLNFNAQSEDWNMSHHLQFNPFFGGRGGPLAGRPSSVGRSMTDA